MGRFKNGIEKIMSDLDEKTFKKGSIIKRLEQVNRELEEIKEEIKEIE